MATVVVTGGSGWLGRYVVDSLFARGVARVRVLDLAPLPKCLLDAHGHRALEHTACEIRSPAAVTSALSSIPHTEVDSVIQLAGYDLGDAPEEAAPVGDLPSEDAAKAEDVPWEEAEDDEGIRWSGCSRRREPEAGYSKLSKYFRST